MGVWQVDPTAAQLLSRGARAWHADFFQLAAAAGQPVTTALSMELVNPPVEFTAQFPDGTAVVTSTGFGGLQSAHCAFLWLMVWTLVGGSLAAGAANAIRKPYRKKPSK